MAAVAQIYKNQEILEKMKKIFDDTITSEIIRKQTEFMNAKEKNVLLEPHLGSIKNNASILVTTGAIEQKKHDNIIKLIQEKDLKALKEEIDSINIEQQREDKVNYNQKIFKKMKKIIDDPITTGIIRKQTEFMNAKKKNVLLEPHLESIKKNSSILVTTGAIEQKKHDNIIKLIQEKDLKALKEEIDSINIELEAEETRNFGGKKRKSRKKRRKPKRKSRKSRRKSRKSRRKSRKRRRKSRKRRRR